jgi:hypothetical protein
VSEIKALWDTQTMISLGIHLSSLIVWGLSYWSEKRKQSKKKEIQTLHDNYNANVQATKELKERAGHALKKNKETNILLTNLNTELNSINKQLNTLTDSERNEWSFKITDIMKKYIKDYPGGTEKWPLVYELNNLTKLS